MKSPIIVVARLRVDGVVNEVVEMFEYDAGQEDQAIAKYRELEVSPLWDDVYFAHIKKEKH